MFTKLFLITTDPSLTWNTFFSFNVFSMIILSIIFHTIFYTSFCNIVSYIFYGKVLSNTVNTRLISSLLIIMLFGYIGRLTHVKEVYRDFDRNYEKTKEFVQQHYNSWIFIA